MHYIHPYQNLIKKQMQSNCIWFLIEPAIEPRIESYRDHIQIWKRILPKEKHPGILDTVQGQCPLRSIFFLLDNAKYHIAERSFLEKDSNMKKNKENKTTLILRSNINILYLPSSSSLNLVKIDILHGHIEKFLQFLGWLFWSWALDIRDNEFQYQFNSGHKMTRKNHQFW